MTRFAASPLSYEQARVFRETGLPVVSVDAKKKELVEYKNGGRECQPKGQRVQGSLEAGGPDHAADRT